MRARGGQYAPANRGCNANFGILFAYFVPKNASLSQSKKPYQVIQMNKNDFKDFHSSSKMLQFRKVP